MDMVKNGIIDPLKVIRTALVDAARLVEATVINLFYIAVYLKTLRTDWVESKLKTPMSILVFLI